MFSVTCLWKVSNNISYTCPGWLKNVLCFQFSDVPFTGVLGCQECFLNRKPQMNTSNVWTEHDMVSYTTGIEVAVRAIWKTLKFIVQNYRSIIHAAVWAYILLLLLPLIYIS